MVASAVSNGPIALVSAHAEAIAAFAAGRLMPARAALPRDLDDMAERGRSGFSPCASTNQAATS